MPSRVGPLIQRKSPMPALPSGTVTFLFTDIEGSTRMLTKLRDRYEQVLRDYRRLLRAAFEQAGGQEIDTQGDAFFVAFDRGKAAVVAAVEAQRAFAAHVWPDGVELRVRMGITTGEPSIGDEGFTGLPVHRGARICAAAHGGQVLLSGATRHLVEDDLPPAVRLLDLGAHRLKDIERPEHVFQLVIEGLSSDFPPLKTLDIQPAPKTPFEGHESELAMAAQATVAMKPGRTLGVSRALGLDLFHRKGSLGLLVDAVWTATTRPLALLALAGLVLAAIFVEPWIAAALVPFYGWAVWSTARGLRFLHGFEWMGMRVHAMAGLTEDQSVRASLRKLGMELIDASRLAVWADDQLHAVDRTKLMAKLDNYREALTLSPSELREADNLAAKITALDELTAQRRALDQECDGLEEKVIGLRDRMFDARRDPASSLGIAEEVEALWKSTNLRRTALRDAHERAKELFGSRQPRRFAFRRQGRPVDSGRGMPSVVYTSGAVSRSPTEKSHSPYPGLRPSPDRSKRGASRTDARSKVGTKTGHWRCFWRWPFGHSWERVADGNVAFFRCSGCGKAIDTSFHAPASTHGDRWRPGGE